jgi:hypothetical protein
MNARRFTAAVVVGIAFQSAVTGAATVYGVAPVRHTAVVVAPAPRPVVVVPPPRPVVVVAPAPAVVVLPSGYIAVLPVGYRAVVVGGGHYFLASGVYYQPRFYQGRTVYVRVRL